VGERLLHTAPKSELWDYSERLITLESSARSCHPNESTGRPVRFYKLRKPLTGEVRSYRPPVELWNSQRAGSRHYCAKAHSEVYVSRWFDSVCAPPRPSFT